ncbi:MAG TPA: hypothetical protein VNM14_25300 [Planctomycetota bacterium]|nr:hypothetical protein [Planctomycetota bacterium]
MSDPLDKITLSLRPKPPEGSAAPKGDPSTEPLPSGMDRAVLDELRAAARTYDYLRQFGDPIEFWEAVRLARSRRCAPDPSKGKGSADPGLAEELQVIRRQLSPMVRDLRRFLEKVPELPPAGEALEVALGFLLASSKEHQAVAKWLAESDKHLAKAASKLRSLATIAAPYLEVMRPWSLDGKYSAASEASAAAGSPAPAGPAVAIDNDLLDNLRRSFTTRAAFDATQLPSAFWEVLMLNTAERIPSQARLMRIIEAKKERQLSVFHEETRYLHGRMLTFRARHSRWVEAFQAWARGLQGVPRDEIFFDMAIALAVVEPDAQERARKWLAAPHAHAKEAAELLAGHAARAKAHTEELRKAASAPVPEQH